MRKILSISEMAEKDKRRRRFGGIVIIFLLVLSTLGFALSNVGISDVNNYEEGFSYNGQNWVYSVNEQKYYFTHHPDELNSSLSGLTKTLADFSGKQIYVDSEMPLALQEIYGSLGVYAGRVSEACYGECEKDLPERQCIAGEEPMIILRDSNSELIREEENCIFIDGNLKTVDSFLYRVLGIN